MTAVAREAAVERLRSWARRPRSGQTSKTERRGTDRKATVAGGRQVEAREPGFQPLDGAATGCTLVFFVAGGMYQPLAALALLAALHAKAFDGACECYIRPGVEDGRYLMGVGLQFGDDPPPDEWWGELVDDVGDACAEEEDLRLDRDRCEFATVGQLRAGMVHAGTAGFEAGSAVWVSDPAGPDPNSPFTVPCRDLD